VHHGFRRVHQGYTRTRQLHISHSHRSPLWHSTCPLPLTYHANSTPVIMAQSPSLTPIFPITLPLSATCPLPPSTAPVPPTMDQKTHQTSSPSTVSEEIWAVLVTVAGRRPRGRNGLILPAREIDKAPTRLLRDLFNSHGLTKLEPCFDPSSGQPAGACLYLATFPSCAAVERAREEWHDAEFDNAFMTRIFLDIIEEDYTILSLLAEPSTPTPPKACIRAAAFVPAPPSNTFEEWWAKRDSKNWASHQRNIEYLTNLRYRGVLALPELSGRS
jgi:hypothetical protein